MALEQTQNLTGKTPRKNAGRLTAQQLATATTAAPKPQSTVTQTFTRLTPSQEEIAKRAHEIWIARGRPHGSDVEDWLKAERELSAK